MNPLRTVRFAWSRLLGRARLAASGVTRGRNVDAIGAPIVSVHPQSSIVLGDDAVLISASFATALGVAHPVVLRTLAPGAEIHIGRGAGMSGGSICAARHVEVGDGTMLGADVMISDTDFHSLHLAHRRAGHAHESVGSAPVRIGRNVFIGTGAIVLKGVSIGDSSVIGAGSVVTSSVPGNCVAAGNPCRVIRELTTAELGDAAVKSGTPIESVC